MGICHCIGRSLDFQWLFQQANCHPFGKTLNTPPQIEPCLPPFPHLFVCALSDFTWNRVVQFFMFSKDNVTYTVLFCMLCSSSCSTKGIVTYNVLHVVQFFMLCMFCCIEPTSNVNSHSLSLEPTSAIFLSPQKTYSIFYLTYVTRLKGSYPATKIMF